MSGWWRSIVMLLAAPVICCCKDNVPMVESGIDESYRVYRMQLLRLRSELTGEACRWTSVSPDGKERVLSASGDCMFVSDCEGVFHLKFEILDSDAPFRQDFQVIVVEEEIEYSPYLSRVYEYRPAPGQFINKMPVWKAGDRETDMIAKAEASIAGTADELVSLGGFGGYITFGFDHTVVNVEGEKDFMILGNAFYEEGFEELKAGSCEPGIVMVALDANGNGLPDDPWYELAGSEYSSALTLHDYSITYRRPDSSKPAVPQGPYILDAEYIPWHDSLGESGYIARNFQHTQDYFPKWLDADELAFTGSRLADNALDVYGNGRYFQLNSYPWGYVDNHPNYNADLCSFDIGWAVDSYGMPVHLPGVDFIRVYTALNQYCNWIGETSTEISRAQDLHLLREY